MMFNSVGYKIKMVAVTFTIIVLSFLVLCAVASVILLISGRSGDFSLKILIGSVAGGVIIYFLSLLLFGFGHIIDMMEEQTVLLRTIAEDKVSSYEKNNNLFVE